MAEFIFLPVPTSEMTRMARQICRRRRNASQTEPTIVRNFFAEGAGKGMARQLGGGCLRGIGGNDRLYLLLHGTGGPGSEWVAADRNVGKRNAAKRYKTYTPAQIADLLHIEGLTVNFSDLILLCCGAGLEGAEGSEFAKSIGERVYDAMVPRYPQIMVTAYLGDVLVGAGDDYRIIRPMAGMGGKVLETVDAPDARVVFPR